MSRRLIKGGFVVSVDPRIGNLDNADVLIEDGKISAIGRNLAAADAEIIDAREMIVMPGFVDTHRHIWQGAMRAVTADWSLLNYLGGIRMSAAACYRPEDMYAAQLQGALEAINAGVTTITDYCHNLNTPDHAYEAIRGLQDAGLRAIWNYGFNRPPLGDPAFKTQGERLQFARTLAAQYFSQGDAILTMGVAPEEAALWLDDSAGKAQFASARELGARLFWHCNCLNHGGGRPQEVARLDALGLLDHDIVLSHMRYTTPEEWRLVAERGAAVAFTPDTELQMGMGYPSTVIARQHGIPHGYGADITSNNSADMFTPLRLALQVARAEINAPRDGELYDGVPIPCNEALRWGTLEGARVLGLDHRIGSLTPGKDADIILLNTDSITLVGWDRTNPAATIIQQASVVDVDTVMIKGKVLKRHGVLLADVKRACRLLSEAAAHVGREVAAKGGFYVDPQRTFQLMHAVTSARHVDAFRADYQEGASIKT